MVTFFSFLVSSFDEKSETAKSREKGWGRWRRRGGGIGLTVDENKTIPNVFCAIFLGREKSFQFESSFIFTRFYVRLGDDW